MVELQDMDISLFQTHVIARIAMKATLHPARDGFTWEEAQTRWLSTPGNRILSENKPMGYFVVANDDNEGMQIGVRPSEGMSLDECKARLTEWGEKVVGIDEINGWVVIVRAMDLNDPICREVLKKNEDDLQDYLEKTS